jgi:hypothetical protein
MSLRRLVGLASFLLEHRTARRHSRETLSLAAAGAAGHKPAGEKRSAATCLYSIYVPDVREL